MGRTVELPWQTMPPEVKKKPPVVHCQHCGKDDAGRGGIFLTEDHTATWNPFDWWFCGWECVVAYVKGHDSSPQETP